MKLRKKKNALAPETREKICDHPHIYYSGQIPCTGPRKCSLCGMTFDSDTEIEAAREVAQKEIARRQKPEPWFLNRYKHCGQVWEDQWDCMCNDRCPVCNKEIEPIESTLLHAGKSLKIH